MQNLNLKLSDKIALNTHKFFKVLFFGLSFLLVGIFELFKGDLQVIMYLFGLSPLGIFIVVGWFYVLLVLIIGFFLLNKNQLIVSNKSKYYLKIIVSLLFIILVYGFAG